MSAVAKTLRARRHEMIQAARAILETENATADDLAKHDALMAQAEGIKAQYERIEAAAAAEGANEERIRAAAERRGVSADEQRERVAIEDAAFSAYLRGGMRALTDEQRQIAQSRYQAAQSVGTNTAGGYTVPQGFYGQIESALKAYGGMLDVSFVFQTDTGNTLPIPTDNDTANAGAILAENVQVSTQDVTFGAVNLGAFTYTSKLILVSNQLLQDSAFDLNGFLADRMGTRIARAINAHFTTGDGSSKPSGVVTGATLGKTGASGQTASIIFDDLIDLMHSVDPAHRPGGRYMMADSTLQAVKKLKDGEGRYLWQPGLPQSGDPDRINGMPYTINQDVAAMATSAKSVLFGDFRKYYIRQVSGTQVLRLTERYADYNQTGFLAFQRWDGALVDAGQHPVKYYANAAS